MTDLDEEESTGASDLRTPVYVRCGEFYLRQHEEERDELRKTKRWVGRWSAVVLLCIFASFAAFIYGFQKNNVVPINNFNAVLTGCGLMGLAIAGTVANWIKVNERLTQQLWKVSDRIVLANRRLKHHAYFGDEDSQWAKHKDPVGAVDHWCKVNRIPAVVARYDDPMFGQFGLYISFCNQMDPEADEENLIFFKMKFLDKF